MKNFPLKAICLHHLHVTFTIEILLQDVNVRNITIRVQLVLWSDKRVREEVCAVAIPGNSAGTPIWLAQLRPSRFFHLIVILTNV